MTPLLLHGSATSASRKKLQSLKEKFNQDNIVVFETDEDVESILINLQSISLFGGDRLVVIENPPQDLANCTLSTVPCTLVLWFDHEVDPKKWPGFELLFFPEAKEITAFPFLDYLAVKDQKAFLEIEKLKQAGFDIHYFLTMTFYLLRNLIATPKTAPDFVRRKLAKQRAGFSIEKITELYKELLEIDFKIKSGLLEKPQAEFLLVNKFLN